MNKKNLAKQLDSIAANVARKGIYVVTKENDLFVVKEHVTGCVVIQDIPVRSLAEYLCNLKNKNKKPSINAARDIKDLVMLFFKYTTDIVFYKNTLKKTTDSTKYFATEARMLDTIARLARTRRDLQRYR